MLASGLRRVDWLWLPEEGVLVQYSERREHGRPEEGGQSLVFKSTLAFVQLCGLGHIVAISVPCPLL